MAKKYYDKRDDSKFRECERCTKVVYRSIWGRHRSMCDTLPTPDELCARLRASPELRVVDIWNEYPNVYVSMVMLKERVLLGEMTKDDLHGRVGSIGSARYRKDWSGGLRTWKKQQRKCSICKALLDHPDVVDNGDGRCVTCVSAQDRIKKADSGRDGKLDDEGIWRVVVSGT